MWGCCLKRPGRISREFFPTGIGDDPQHPMECISAESDLNRAKGSLQHMPLGQMRVSKPIRTAMASEAMETNPYAILAPRFCAS